MEVLLLFLLILIMLVLKYVMYDYMMVRHYRKYKEEIKDYIKDNSKWLDLPETKGELYVFNKYSTDEMKNKLRNFDEQYKKGNRPKNPFKQKI